MSDRIIVDRLRKFFLLLGGFMCLGTEVELLLVGHSKEPMQLVPFLLCGMGLIAVIATVYAPQRNTIQALRMVMAFLMAGSLLGVYEHLVANFAFAQEVRPNADIGKLLLATLTGGSPLLAPGTLALTAVTTIAATYYHPAMQEESAEQRHGYTAQKRREHV